MDTNVLGFVNDGEKEKLVSLQSVPDQSFFSLYPELEDYQDWVTHIASDEGKYSLHLNDETGYDRAGVSYTAGFLLEKYGDEKNISEFMRKNTDLADFTEQWAEENLPEMPGKKDWTDTDFSTVLCRICRSSEGDYAAEKFPGILDEKLYGGKVRIMPYEIWEHSDFGYHLHVNGSDYNGLCSGFAYLTADDAEKAGLAWSMENAGKIIGEDFSEASHIVHGNIYAPDTAVFDGKKWEKDEDHAGEFYIGDYYDSADLAREIYGGKFCRIDEKHPEKYTGKEKKLLLAAAAEIKRIGEIPYGAAVDAGKKYGSFFSDLERHEKNRDSGKERGI